MDGWNVPNSLDNLPGDRAVKLAEMAYGALAARSRRLSGRTRYNCHGLTFGARRTSIPPPGEDDDGVVREILRRDGYHRVASTPRVGDVVTYVKEGKITHRGLVSRIESLQLSSPGGPPHVFVWSAWGGFGEFEHRADGMEDFYGRPEYWRVTP